MARVSFKKLMNDAAEGGYAVGYFESWNLESLLAVADAAEAERSPVIMGFSGIYLPHPDRVVQDSLADYAAMIDSVASRLSVPCCTLFNECANEDWVRRAIDLGFDMVMFSDPDLPAEQQRDNVHKIANAAHKRSVAVEGEPAALEGVGGTMADAPIDQHQTDPQEAYDFLVATSVDSLAVNVGQVHLHGRKQVSLDLDRLARIRDRVNVPLVLHGATSVSEQALADAVRCGIRKINVGSSLKQAFWNGMNEAVAEIGGDANPYEIIGSGLATDVLVRGRTAMCAKVRHYMNLFGSSNRSGVPGARAG